MKKIIFLIAPPRSLSTALLRMIGKRGDFKIINEPSCSVFNYIHYPHSNVFYSAERLTSYREAKNKIWMAAENTNVFVKEMSYSFEEFITFEPTLLTDPAVTFVFLLRNPHSCTISYYQKMPVNVVDYIIDDFEKLIGYRSLYVLFKKIQQESVRCPYLLHAERLYSHTKKTIQDVCDYIDVPYKESALTWESLDENFTGFHEWDENKKREFTQHWHKEALHSHGFHQPTIYETDRNGCPTFSEIKNDVHKVKCRTIYEASKKYYDLINDGYSL